MKTLFILFTLALTSIPALARDSSHLICAGFMAATPGSDNYGFAVQFDESRAESGESRNEMLSTVWAGKLYQGVRLNNNDDFGKNGTISMAAANSTSEIFFKGSYELIQSRASKSYPYKLKLKGQMNLSPSDALSLQQVSTTLNCLDISN